MDEQEQLKEIKERADKIVQSMARCYLQAEKEYGQQEMPVVILALTKFTATLINALKKQNPDEDIERMYLSGVIGFLDSIQQSEKKEDLINALQDQINKNKERIRELERKSEILIKEGVFEDDTKPS